MPDLGSIELKRDCSATRIPVGEQLILPAGTQVEVTQTLGGAYTVRALGGLFRIASKDVDALGLAPLDATTISETQASSDAKAESPVNEEQVWNTLRTCYDPEIPVNIVDLGLVYDLRIEALPSGGNRVGVKMTLTAPGCGMGPAIAGDAQQRLLELPGVDDASVEIVWDPPWHHSMISPAGRLQLGLE